MKYWRYIIYPLIIISITYLSISMYSLTFNVSKWTPDDRIGLMVITIISVIIDIMIEWIGNAWEDR